MIPKCEYLFSNRIRYVMHDNRIVMDNDFLKLFDLISFVVKVVDDKS